METLRTRDATVVVDHDHGGRLASVALGGHELLLGAGEATMDPIGWGCFPMVPWAGRIRHGRFHHDGEAVELPLGMPPHAIHGTTHLRPWTAIGPGRLHTELGEDWPWSGTATQHIELTPGRLSLTIGVHSSEPMPVSAGWHPWFRRRIGGASVGIDLPAEHMWRRDAQGIPDGTLVEPPPGPWDDCFTALVGPVVLSWPGVLTLAIESDCDHVVVYDEQEAAVCVEPQSAPPDAHNSGEDLAVVVPGRDWTITTTWLWDLA